MNSARVTGYMDSGECPVNWIICDPCEGIADASGDLPYTDANMSEAPWWDDEDEATHRFYGVHAITVEGADDSTRTASVAEGILDGGVIGHVRHAVRQVRVRALLSGQGEDGLEAGLSWLKSVLDPDSCGIHGNSCGAVDVCFYAACPPMANQFFTTETQWAFSALNLATNPSFEAPGIAVEVRRNRIINPGPAATTGWTGIGVVTPLTAVDGHLRTTSTGDSTSSTIPRAQLVGATGATPVTAGESIYVRLEVKHSRGLLMELRLWFMDAAGTYVSYSASAVSGATTDWTPIEEVATVPAGATLMGYQVIVRSDLPGNGSLNGDVFEFRNLTTDRGTYFDGSTPAAGDFTYAWVGAVGTSASVENGVQPQGVPSPTAAQAVLWRASEAPYLGTYISRLRTVGAASTAIGIPVSTAALTTGTTYTLLGRVRPRNRAQAFIPRIRSTQGTTFTAPMGVWTEFRAVVSAGAGTATQTGLLMATNSGHQPGDLIDVDQLLIVEGNYTGGYFDGSSTDSTDPWLRFDWSGTANASTSVAEVGTPIQVPDPEAYQEAVDRLLRRLHNVTTISGPLIEQKIQRGNTFGYIVEFTLAAASPFIFSQTRQIEVPPSLPEVVQDVPFNLIPYPSGELTSGTVIVARNLSTNPSLETNAVGWAATATPFASQPAVSTYFTHGRVTGELDADGDASYRARILGNGSTAVPAATAQVIIEALTAITGLATNTRVSFSVWGATAIIAGGGVSSIQGLRAQAQFVNASSTVLGTVNLGSALSTEFGGRVFAAKSQAVPAGTTSISVQVIADVTWGSSATPANNSDLRVYADALAITIP